MWPFDPNKQQMYQRFAQAYDSSNLDQIDPHEAAGYLQQFMQNAPPSMQQQVFQECFSRCSIPSFPLESLFYVTHLKGIGASRRCSCLRRGPGRLR